MHVPIIIITIMRYLLSFDCFALLVCFLSCYSSKVVVPVAELAVCGVRGGGVVSRGVRTL